MPFAFQITRKNEGRKEREELFSVGPRRMLHLKDRRRDGCSEVKSMEDLGLLVINYYGWFKVAGLDV